LPVTLAVFVETVLIAVQFYNQPALETEKVHDVIADLLLTLKFETRKMPAAKAFPEDGFVFGRGLVELTGQVLKAIVIKEFRYRWLLNGIIIHPSPRPFGPTLSRRGRG
jgi:hypothetical protein